MGIPPATSAVYLRLYHGRHDPDQDLDEWGSEGPVIGPLGFVQVTYMCDIKFAASPQVMERFFPDIIAGWRSRGQSNAAGPLCDWRLDLEGDLLLYDGVYYGDWSVTSEIPGGVGGRSTENLGRRSRLRGQKNGRPRAAKVLGEDA